MEVEISLLYPSALFARSMMRALSPDNKLAKDEIKISAKVHGNTLRVLIKNCKRIETLQATVQDIFRCLRAAESSLRRAATLHEGQQDV